MLAICESLLGDIEDMVLDTVPKPHDR
ncbi:hypothetical protein XELAEV_180317142mg, partial [Xenopus laevis]